MLRGTLDFAFLEQRRGVVWAASGERPAKLTFRKKWTFWQRFRNVAIFWGIPMACVELIGLPVIGWAFALVVAVPATLVGVLAYTAFEHLLISVLAKGQTGNQ